MWHIAAGWTVRGSNPAGGVEIFRSRLDRLCGPPILRNNGYPVSFPGVERPGCGVVHLRPGNTEVKERVQLFCTHPPGFHVFFLGDSYLYLYQTQAFNELFPRNFLLVNFHEILQYYKVPVQHNILPPPAPQEKIALW